MQNEETQVVGVSSGSGGGKPSLKIIGAIVGIVFLVLGIVAGILLVRQNQNISEKAEVQLCSQGAEECPSAEEPNKLRNCHPPESDGTPEDTLCGEATAKKRVFCGTRYYCCPSAGAAWSTNLTLCPEGTPTASATATATATAVSSSTVAASATATATATSRASATATSRSTSTARASATATATTRATTSATTSATQFPVPQTGTSLPTYLGIGLGLVILVVSLVIAI